MKRIFLTPPQPSRNLKPLPFFSSRQLEPSPLFRSLPTLDNMPRAANTSNTPKHAYGNWFSHWCEVRKPKGLLCTRKLAGEAWRKMSEDEKAIYCVQESLHVTGPFCYLDEDEDLINNVVSSNASPVQGEEIGRAHV